MTEASESTGEAPLCGRPSPVSPRSPRCRCDPVVSKALSLRVQLRKSQWWRRPARLRTGARRPMAFATAPRSSQKARGPRDRWAGLAARGSGLGSLQVAGALGRAPRQRWLPSGIASAYLLRRGVGGTQEVGLQRENLSDHLPGRGQSRARDGQLEERFLTWVCPVPQNHLWSLFKGGKRCPHLISRDSDSVGLGLLGEITGILILGGESLQS